MKKILQTWGRPGGIIVFLIVVFLSGNMTGNGQIAQTKVLGASTHSTPMPTITPAPTTAPITIINNIIVPSTAPTVAVTPTPTAVPTITPAPTQIIITPTPMPFVSPTAMPTVTPTVSPTPIPQTVSITIDYAEEHSISTYSAIMTANESAWQTVQNAIGLTNMQYTDYGGSLGIFITGFNGISASANQYYDFQVNGTSSNVGVSSYIVQDNDALKFVLTGF